MSSQRKELTPELYTVSSGGSSQTRTRILERTLKLVREGKGQLATMAEVARAAGVSRQAIYLHFADRAALFIAVARYVDERRGLQTELEKIWTAPDGVAALREMAALQARQNPKVWPIARAMDAIRRNDESAEKAWQDRLAARMDGARRVVSRLLGERLLRRGLDPETAAGLLWSITSLRAWEDLVLGQGWSASKYERETGNLLVRTLTNVEV